MNAEAHAERLLCWLGIGFACGFGGLIVGLAGSGRLWLFGSLR